MIYCCMNKKQEIRQQIQFLQGELAAMDDGLEVIFGNWACCVREYQAKVESLSDSDIIDALSNHPDIRIFVNSDVVVRYPVAGYCKTFHVTRNVSYNITPF